ncbi:Disease resistance protein (NBS-LRR class) family [Raphanus sativus]|nr:Disease resistance protein (NBS-LRR class) family [Raphanus sativus]
MLLDDIWRKVDLEEIGIPLPSPENGSKVVFTTRSKYVCGRMGPDDLEVKHLDPENAWELFRQKVRGATLDNDPKILELARKVCEKCKGLPLALNVIGETMAFKTSVREWQCAIDDLNSNADDYPEVKDEILKILKLSYDDLKDETVQQCFQYCVLFPGDFFIYKDMMVEYWISEGIINGGGDRERAINHGHRIFGKLVNACLLMPVDTSEYVTMHDVIRQMALWVASNCGEKEEKVIVKIGAGLQQMPEVRDWNAVRRMSLSNNKIQNISISPECPNLTTLLLRNNNLENISGEFFLSMPNLVTLNLSYNINLTKLPEEVSNLVSLRFLELTKTRLKNLPAGLGKLIQLRYLSLSCVQTRPSLSVISSLVNIEMLLLIKTTYLSLELIEDIKLMKNLKGLGVSINDVVVLERLLSIPKLASCIEHISLDQIVAKDGALQFVTAMASLRSIVIQACIISDIMEHTRYGFRSASPICFQNLFLVEITGVSGIQDLSWLLFAPKLAFLTVKGPSPELQEIVSREKVSGLLNEGSSIVPFRKIQSIHLEYLEELKSIYWERLELPSLKRMSIRHCQKLEKLPLSKERAYNFNLHKEDEEWFDGLEWEDEATED